jgi:polyribonucleotide nucleotidyltransferase
MLDIKEKKFMLGDKEIVITMGEYAHQANGAITLRCGETLVQAVAVMGKTDSGTDFFPLTVEYNENLYAGGLIKSSKFVKREGKPSDEAILKARLIDRSIRPMFSKDMRREVQVIINVLSSDRENPHDVLGLTAACAALAVSDIPFDCNIGGIRLSQVDGKFVVNPTYAECERQDFELVLGGNANKVIMIECASNCVKDEVIIKAFEESYKYLGQVANAIVELQNEYGKKKIELPEFPNYDDLIERVKDVALKGIEEFSKILEHDNSVRARFDEIIVNPVLALFTEEELADQYLEENIRAAIDKIFKKYIRSNVLQNHKRIDNRQIEQIREIHTRINPVPRVHGSSMFMRGETQVLNILTLAAPGNEQILETIEGESAKRYIHHYNAPPFSVGEVGRYGGTGRREIGHGALAEKALRPVIPGKDKFPYIMRLVSEVQGQNGSSSMASTCASTLTLMAAGVQIKEPVAGISIGLITGETDDEFVTLTDIMGYEDFCGDMDFKVAGTRDAITAIQMDTKIKGLTFPIVKQAIEQANRARNKILDIIINTIAKPADDISKYAPRIDSIVIPVDEIGKIIGPGGKMIKQLQQDNNVELAIDEEGNVSISGTEKEGIENVKRIITGMITDPTVGEIYNAKVVRIMEFGAFVEIFPGKEGLVHVSRISKERVNNVSDVLSVGQPVKVKLIGIDAQSRLNFSMNLDDDIEDPNAPKENRKERFGRGGHDRDKGEKRERTFKKEVSTEKKS